MRWRPQPWDDVLALGLPPNEPRLAHRVLVPAPAAADRADPATTCTRGCADALRRRGIERLWSHQARAWELARAGRHVGVVTGTASGKSLAYGLPVLQRLLDDPHARAIYLAPTKALAQDQARGLFALGLGALTAAGAVRRRHRARPHAARPAAAPTCC